MRTLAALARHWEARKRYVYRIDWALYIYNRLLRKLHQLPLPGRHSVAGIVLKGHQNLFYLRLGTTDWLVLEEIFEAGEYAFVRECLRNVARIVDLGANAGFSLRYWHELFPRANILAVEPDPGNCCLCLRNSKAAKFEHQVTLVPACVGAHRRQVQLTGREEWAYHMQDNNGNGAATVEVVPLINLLETHAKGETIDLLKCDIEGAEAELFRDCHAWIGRVNAIVIELHPPYSIDEFRANLWEAGANFELVKQLRTKHLPVVLMRRQT